MEKKAHSVYADPRPEADESRADSGSVVKQTFELSNRMSELVPMLDDFEALMLREQIPADIVGEKRLITEEAVSNVIRHAYEDGENRGILVTVACENGVVTVEIRDSGKAFNPLAATPPDLDKPVEERPDGGLGIHLIKNLADEINYLRDGEINILVLRKRLQ